MKKIIIVVILIVLVIIGGYFGFKFFKNKRQSPPTAIKTQTPAASNAAKTPTPTISKTGTPQSLFAEPVADFKKRVTKKPFGIYITPQNSPVQPERFTGYHTGADAEYQDITSDVTVYSIADGKVVLSKTASGYGGVFMIEFELNGTKHTALYGHIRPSSLPKVGQQVTKGEKIGLLGTGYSQETDGERKHLHFAILVDDSLNIKGYVQSQSELSGWIDPLTIL